MTTYSPRLNFSRIKLRLIYHFLSLNAPRVDCSSPRKNDASTIAVVNPALEYRFVFYGFEFDSIREDGRGH